MKKFYGFFDNGKYQVGCGGGTIYVYDRDENELARFKGLSTTYKGAFHPGRNIFAAKSTNGLLVAYDLDTLSLIRKINIHASAQDEGFAYSPSGDVFYNIEKPVLSTRTQLTVYDGVTFDKKEVYFENEEKMHLEHIETYPGEIYLFGFMRGESGCGEYPFAARFIDGRVADIREIKTKLYDTPGRWMIWFDTDYEYVKTYKNWELHGFTEKEAETKECLKQKPFPPVVTVKKIWELNG